MSLVGDNPRTFTVWGPEKQLPPGFSRETDAALVTEHGVRPYLGDMVLDIKWMPESPSRPEAGLVIGLGPVEEMGLWIFL